MSLDTYVVEEMRVIKCPFCREQLADSHLGYSAHLEMFHSEKSPYKVKRTTDQIVADWEARNKGVLINGSIHPDTCVCMKCINARLDAIIMQQEEQL